MRATGTVLCAAAAVALASSARGRLLPRQHEPTPNRTNPFITCEGINLDWDVPNGGIPPFIASIFPAGTTTNPYVTFPPVEAPPVPWVVNIAGGVNVTFSYEDATGKNHPSRAIVITKGPDTSCVNITGLDTSSSTTGSTTQTQLAPPGTATSSDSNGSSTASSGTASSTAPGSTSPTGHPKGSNSTTIAIAVGCALGGTVLVLGGVLAWFVVRRRRRRSSTRFVDGGVVEGYIFGKRATPVAEDSEKGDHTRVSLPAVYSGRPELHTVTPRPPENKTHQPWLGDLSEPDAYSEYHGPR